MSTADTPLSTWGTVDLITPYPIWIIMSTAEISQIEISRLLRTSDKVLVSLPCRIRQPGTGFVKADAVLISHDVRGNEEAALIIYLANGESSHPQIIHALPINSRFKHNLLQTPPSPSVSYFQQSARPHITLDVRLADENYELRIAAHHSLVVQSLTKELRRLALVIRTLFHQSHTSTPLSLQHEWLHFYPISPVPEDLAPSTSTSMSDKSPRAASALGMVSQDAAPLVTPMSSMSVTDMVTMPVEDDEHPNPHLSTFSRPAFLRKRLFGRASKWSENKTIKIRCSTYNVNDKLPPKGTTELASIVGDGSDDLLVFGFQEADVRHQALLFAQGNDRAAAWEEALFRGLGDRASEFEKLAFSQYVGVMTIVLVRKTLRSVISRVETSEKGIGLLGFVGNKAGVAVRLKVYDTTLAFVNCHLAAFANALDRRRMDYSTLLDSLSFPRPLESEVSVLAYEEFLPDQPDRMLSLQDSNAIFWLGDLNYRIDMEDDKLAPLVKWKRWQEVLEHDQLRSDIAQGRSFAGFQEAPINFPPSYKYVHGSTTLDTRRPAAYTDRVLYTTPTNTPSATSSSTASIVTAETYTSHDILWSDHRPVTCEFQVNVRIPDEEKRKVVLAQVRSELDKLDEEWAPSIEVDQLEVEFGDIRYGRVVTREVVLRNKGRVPATFDFKAPVGKQICKPIYWPFPATGILQPGAETAMKVTLRVDTKWSPKLTIGEDETNDVLVLQVAGGKDTFITLHANYLPSIVGLPLTQLNKLPNGIRQVPLAQRKRLTDAVPLLTPKDEGEDPYKAKSAKAVKPAQAIWRLLESLMEKHDGTLWSGDSELIGILDVIEALDADTPLPDCPPSTISHTLIDLLAALPTPLVPAELQQQCCAAEDRDDGFAILEGVEGVHTNILIGLMSVVRLCDPEAGSNASTVESLVPAVFGPQQGTERDEAEYERQGRNRFVKLLLEG